MADMSPGQRLAGIFGPRFRGAMAVPQEDMAMKLARALGAFDNNTQTGAPSVTTQATPPALPPFVPPGNAMTEAIGPPQVAQQTMPATTVQAPPAAGAALPSPTAATQPQLAPAAVPPMPAPVTVRDDVLKAAQQMLAQNLLPEQWKGAFTNPQGFPR